jgi:hypothetical protein
MFIFGRTEDYTTHIIKLANASCDEKAFLIPDRKGREVMRIMSADIILLELFPKARRILSADPLSINLKKPINPCFFEKV